MTWYIWHLHKGLRCSSLDVYCFVSGENCCNDLFFHTSSVKVTHIWSDGDFSSAYPYCILYGATCYMLLSAYILEFFFSLSQFSLCLCLSVCLSLSLSLSLSLCSLSLSLYSIEILLMLIKTILLKNTTPFLINHTHMYSGHVWSIQSFLISIVL